MKLITGSKKTIHRLCVVCFERVIEILNDDYKFCNEIFKKTFGIPKGCFNTAVGFLFGLLLIIKNDLMFATRC